jgi:hypothetical protein
MTPSDIDKKLLDEFRVTYEVGRGGGVRSSTHPASADRPWCALIAACLSSARLGGVIGTATCRGMDVYSLVARAASIDPAGVPRHLAGHARRPAPSHIPEALGPFTLDAYQLDAVRRMRPGGVILDYKVGLGKTLTALACLRQVLGGAAYRYALVVCPLNAMPTWKDAIRWAASELICHIDVVSADSLHTVAGLKVGEGAALIIDEAQYFGSVSAERTKQAHALRWKFSCGILLTGSMLTAGPDKALSLLDLCCPGAAGFANKWDLGRAFSAVVEKPIPGTKRTAHEVVRPTGPALEHWNQWLEPWTVSKTKRSPDVIESVQIPDQMVHTVELNKPTWRSLVDAACDVARDILAQTGELPSMMEVSHRLAREGIADKLDWLAEQMADNAEQVVVFGTYHESLDAVEDWLRSEGITFVRVDGSTPAKSRAALIGTFTSGKARVFLAQTDAASVSMNLQCANISVMVDVTMKAAAKEQAQGRTCRRGSTHLCHHFDLVANQFQASVFKRLAISLDFNASSAEWQDLRQALKGLQP